MSTPQARTDELAHRLRAVRERLSRACTAAGRGVEEVTLVAITKTYPASDAAILRGLGIVDVGESREPEASGKALELAGGDPPLRWHFVGQIQSRKAKTIAGYAYAVHSLDRAEVADRLAVARPAELGPLAVLIQVSLDGDTTRGGLLPADVAALAGHVEGLDRLRLAGVMAVAPRAADPDESFARLHAVSEDLRRDHPEAVAISAGMSGDLEQAVKNGATHVRVGSALLGARQP